MARYPGATWRPVDRYKAGARLAAPMVRYDAVVGHTAVSSATPSMHSYFNVSGRATPHVYFGQGGEVEQYIDTKFRSSAVLNGNHRCITWEAWDGFPAAWSGGVCPPYTNAQAESMAKFAAWVHKVHGVPLVRMPNSRPTSKGIGWHRLGIDGNFPTPPGTLLGGRVGGGETWTLSNGKTCPTDKRIRQFPEQIIPRALEIAGGTVTPPDFQAATWNVFNGTPRETLEPTLHKLLRSGVSLILGQEMSQAGHRQMLKDAGLLHFFHPPQYVIAWDPTVWTEITACGVRLSQTGFQRKGGSPLHFSEAAQAILCDRKGRTLTAMSYHTPPDVQPVNPPANRIKALRESAVSWKRIADEAETRAILFGGDDNVDERLGGGPWGFMLKAATGLHQVTAPAGTHGGGDRKIDDFRTRGVRAGSGRVLKVPAPDDHHVHVHGFTWK